MLKLLWELHKLQFWKLKSYHQSSINLELSMIYIYSGCETGIFMFIKTFMNNDRCLLRLNYNKLIKNSPERHLAKGKIPHRSLSWCSGLSQVNVQYEKKSKIAIPSNVPLALHFLLWLRDTLNKTKARGKKLGSQDVSKSMKCNEKFHLKLIFSNYLVNDCTKPETNNRSLYCPLFLRVYHEFWLFFQLKYSNRNSLSDEQSIEFECDSKESFSSKFGWLKCISFGHLTWTFDRFSKKS